MININDGRNNMKDEKRTMKAQNISIIGLGRLGVSIGLAVQQSSLEVSVVGHDRDNDVAQLALGTGAVNKLEVDVRNLASKADILVLAVPFTELEPLLSVIGDRVQGHTLLLDLTPLKAPSLKLAEKYVGQGHYVGANLVLSAQWLVDGRTELEAASGDVFKNGVFCLMPSPKADPKAVETAVNFGRLLGASPYFVDPMEYDGLLTGVQTVPGLLAAALFRSVAQSTGWRDMLRFAGVPFAMSTQPLMGGEDIVHEALSNKISTLRWLDAVMVELKAIRRLVQDGEAEILTAALSGLFLDRSAWLAEREKNLWIEVDAPDLESYSISSHFLGSLASRRKKDE
jgi:prephenate dehydrogenase